MSDQATPAPPPVTVVTPSAVQPALPRWGVQTGFMQRRQPAFWLFAILFVITGLTVITTQLFFLQIFPAGWIFSIVLMLLYVIPVAATINFLDLFEREPISLVIAAFLWGGVIAIGLAGEINTALIEVLAKLFGPNLAQTWGAALIAPPVEETLKFLGVVTLFLIARTEFDDLLDGFVYGAVIGLGFAAIEHVQYFIQAIAGAGGADQLGPVFGLFLIRAVILGAYMHVLWTGLTGLGLAYYVTQRDQPRRKRLTYLIGLFALAVVAHFIWNSPLLGELLTGFGGIFLFGVIKGMPFLAFIAVMIVLAQRREHRWFRSLTSGDLGTDVLAEEEFAALGGLRSRWAARRDVGARKGAAGKRLAGRMQREQINLAMIRSRAGGDDDPNVVAQRERIRALRAELNALPDMTQPMAAMPAGAAVPAAPGAPGWTPTHFVPSPGMAAWDAPDPARAPVATLAPGVQLSILEQQGAWARVMGSNGWTGWVDGRLLGRLG
ncbi:hypothetical protein BH24CHL5_BH24CHL5_05230 [soil metagenome]